MVDAETIRPFFPVSRASVLLLASLFSCRLRLFLLLPALIARPILFRASPLFALLLFTFDPPKCSPSRQRSLRR